MPKNKGRGGKNRKKGKNENVDQKRELIYKEDGLEYAQVRKMLGNGRVEVYCFDGKTRLGHIIGKMRKKIWISSGDVVLISKRDYQDEKCDVVHKYLPEEVRMLKAYGEIPESIKVDEEEVGQNNNDIDVAFQDSDEEEEDEEEEKKGGNKKKQNKQEIMSDSSDDDLNDI